MSDEYTVVEVQDVSEAEIILNDITNIKDLLIIDMVSTENNVLLLRKTCIALYNEIVKLKTQLNSIEQRTK